MKKIIVIAIIIMTAIAGAAGPASAQLYWEDFENAPPEMVSPTAGYGGYGFDAYFLRIPFGPVNFYLDGLPGTPVDLSFDLAIIDSWDGLTGWMAPDTFVVTIDGATVFSGSFDNTVQSDQSFEPGGALELIVYGQKLAYTRAFKDSAYHVTLRDIPNNGSIHVTWEAKYNGIGFFDESFAIDNVEVTESQAALSSRAAGQVDTTLKKKPKVTAKWVTPESVAEQAKNKAKYDPCED